MFFHCKRYIRNISSTLTAVSTILLASVHANADTTTSPIPKPRIALLGDSMTWIGGDSCQNDTGWSHILKGSGLAAAIDVYARSGATWTNTSATRKNPTHYTELLHDDNVIYNQAVRLIEKADSTDTSPDIIILFAGANDAWFAKKRPGIYDAPSIEDRAVTIPGSQTSLSGSIVLVCNLLEGRFPEATLLFVTPLQMSKTTAMAIHKVSDIIEQTAAGKGWITLRADKETAVTHCQEAKSPKYTYDGVHTNPAGAEILGEYIVLHLKNLLNTQPQNSTTSQSHN